MPTFSYSSERPAGRPVDLLVLPVFEGPAAGPGVKDVKDIDLLGLFEASGATGKRGEFLLVPNTGMNGLAAEALLLVGVGDRGEADADTCRRAIGRVASKLAKRKRVSTTLPQIVRGRNRVSTESLRAQTRGLRGRRSCRRSRRARTRARAPARAQSP